MSDLRDRIKDVVENEPVSLPSGALRSPNPNVGLRGAHFRDGLQLTP